MPYEGDYVSELAEEAEKPRITIEQAKSFVTRLITEQGLVPSDPVLEGRFWFVRLKSPKGQAIGVVTISPYIVDSSVEHAEELLKQETLEAIRAGLKEPIMRAMGDA